MELWQLDLVHGFVLADGTSAKALTGVDDHSRYCVSARLMARERTKSVCDGFSSAMQAYRVPSQVLTDNGKDVSGPQFEQQYRIFGQSFSNRSSTVTG